MGRYLSAKQWAEKSESRGVADVQFMGASKVVQCNFVLAKS